MKSRLRSFATAATFLAVYLSASATTINVNHNTDITFSASGTTTYSNTWIIPGASYDPVTQMVTSATASFSFKDMNGSGDAANVTISIDLSGFFKSGVLFKDATLNLGGSITGLALIDLDADGKLMYTISTTNFTSGESFKMDYARLTAEIDPRPASRVPDSGSTLLMLGSVVGALGLFGRVRKFN